MPILKNTDHRLAMGPLKILGITKQAKLGFRSFTIEAKTESYSLIKYTYLWRKIIEFQLTFHMGNMNSAEVPDDIFHKFYIVWL